MSDDPGLLWLRFLFGGRRFVALPEGVHLPSTGFASKSMRIFLHELSDSETVLNFTQAEPWVQEAVSRADEKSDEERLRPESQGNGARPIEIQFSLRKVDDVVVVSGRIETYIRLICSRCANPYQHAIQPQFSALFCKDPVMAGVAHLHQDKVVGHNHGHARHAHDDAAELDQAAGRDLDITYLSHDYVELADVLTEQLQFQIPFQPLCKETCKGICASCGADLNQGRCACAKLTKVSPFSVLKDLKY